MSATNRYKRFSYEERKRLEQMWNEGYSVKEIAETLERKAASIYHELKRGFDGELTSDFRNSYDAQLAQKVYADACRRKGWLKSVSG